MLEAPPEVTWLSMEAGGHTDIRVEAPLPSVVQLVESVGHKSVVLKTIVSVVTGRVVT